MLVIAKGIKGAEFMYNPKTAHKASKASAKKIIDVLNRARYQLKDGEIWHIYNVGDPCYDNGAAYATEQKFTIYKGVVREKTIPKWYL